MLCFSISFVVSQARKSQLLKTDGRGGSAAQDVAKICTTLWIWKSKSLKTGRFRALFEIQVANTCTTLWRESDSEVMFAYPLTDSKPLFPAKHNFLSIHQIRSVIKFQGIEFMNQLPEPSQPSDLDSP